MTCRSLGPGPGAYMLPSTVGYDKHDNRKQRLPQYSFGVRSSMLQKPLGPGPGAYTVDKLTRYGVSHGNEYTMAGRRYMKDNGFGPGPGAHDVHIKPFFKGANAPAYSLGAKHKLDTKVCVPGPNAYKVNVSPIKPGAPAYSIGLKTALAHKAGSPGPAAYGTGPISTVLPRSPEYTMSGRYKLISNRVSPGANNYNLTYYRPGKTGPAYTFGQKHNVCAPPMVVKGDNK